MDLIVQIAADERQLCCSNSLLDVYANRAQYDSPGINTAKLNFVVGCRQKAHQAPR